MSKKIYAFLGLYSLMLLASLCGFCPQSVQAQEAVQAIPTYTATLTILDSNGIPLTGAVARVRGQKSGVAANANGIIEIHVPKNSVIDITFIGMTKATVKVTGPTTRTIYMEEDTNMLDEVVATGYAVTTKKRTTGSVAVINSDELKFKPDVTVDLLLQGTVAGVDVKALSGRPGETGKITIRGANSITGNTEPLWVVDGVPLQKDIPNINSAQIKAGDFNNIYTNGLGTIPPGDIESISILKDASAAAIYGSQAAGGVIVVTTKRGKEGKLRVSYGTNLSMISAPPRSANLMNSKQKLQLEQELWDEFSKARKEAGKRYPVIGIVGAIRAGVGEYEGWTEAQQDAEIARLGSQSTNWFDEIFRNSFSHNHFLSLSGGSAKTRYYSSMSYSKNTGLVKRTEADAASFSLKLDFDPSSKLKMSFSTDLSYRTSQSPSYNVDPFKYAYFANPYERPYNTDGSYAEDKTYFTIRKNHGQADLSVPLNGFNIFREIDETNSDSKNLSGGLRGNIKYTLTDNLSLEGIASFGFVNSQGDSENGKNTHAAWIDRPFENNSITSTRTYGSISQSSSLNLSYMLRAQLNYFQRFGDHNISTLIGTEVRSQWGKSIFEKRYGYDPVSGNSAIPVFPSQKSYKETDMNRYASIVDGLYGQSIFESTFASFYLSADYSYLNRYVVSMSARTDGSNNFGSKEQFNPTGSLGFAWNVDEEEFMDKVDPIISRLVLRVAGGFTGNVNRSVHPQLVMKYLNRFRNTGNNTYRKGNINTPPNPHLRWEKTRDAKVALDLGLFSNRLTLGIEAYDRLTTDAVTSVAVVTTTGYNSQKYNTSTLRNTGVEMTLGASIVKTDDWSVHASTNFGMNYNTLVSYNDPNPNFSSPQLEGYPLGALFSGKVEGIDPILGIYSYKPRPDAKMDSPESRKDFQNYIYYLGTKSAPLNGGYSINVSYKKLTVGLGGTFSVGGIITNEVLPPVDYGSVEAPSGDKELLPDYVNDLYTYHVNSSTAILNRWTPNNPITTGQPRIIDRYGDRIYADNYMVTSSIITRASRLESLSYFKLGNLYASYRFDPSWLKNAGINSLSLSLSASNLWILSTYSGIDPETPGAVYPIPRTYTFGLSLDF